MWPPSEKPSRSTCSSPRAPMKRMTSRAMSGTIPGDPVDQSRVPGVEVAPEVLQAQDWWYVRLRVAEPAVDERVSTDRDRPVLGRQLAPGVGCGPRPIAAEVV